MYDEFPPLPPPLVMIAFRLLSTSDWYQWVGEGLCRLLGTGWLTYYLLCPYVEKKSRTLPHTRFILVLASKCSNFLLKAAMACLLQEQLLSPRRQKQLF